MRKSDWHSRFSPAWGGFCSLGMVKEEEAVDGEIQTSSRLILQYFFGGNQRFFAMF